jgi:hypothetical protein
MFMMDPQAAMMGQLCHFFHAATVPDERAEDAANPALRCGLRALRYLRGPLVDRQTRHVERANHLELTMKLA